LIEHFILYLNFCKSNNSKFLTKKGQDNRKGENDPKNRVDAIFGRMDKNFSNTLDEYEFVKGCLEDEFLMQFLNPQITASKGL
jgi:hypothetical protein